MLDILCPLITESDSVSNELLDIILSNIVEPLKSQRKNAYKLARELLLKCSDTLEPYIQAVCFIPLINFWILWFNLNKIFKFSSSTKYLSLAKKTNSCLLLLKYMIWSMSSTMFAPEYCFLYCLSLNSNWKVQMKLREWDVFLFLLECFQKRIHS